MSSVGVKGETSGEKLDVQLFVARELGRLHLRVGCRSLMADSLPFGQFAIRAEREPEVFSRRRRSDGLADADTAAPAVKSTAYSEGNPGAVFDDPFGNRRSVR